MYEVKVKTSQYKGVSWQKKGCKWFAHLCLKGEQKHGGSFINEMDAAKRVNQLCKQFGIPLQNLGISGIPTQPQVIHNCFFLFYNIETIQVVCKIFAINIFPNVSQNLE